MYNFIFSHIFFKTSVPKQSPFGFRIFKNIKTKQFETSISINPWTTLDDIVKSWSYIVKESYPEHIGKNKPWELFDYEFDIYQEYRKARRYKQNSGDKRAITAIVKSNLSEKCGSITENKILLTYKKVKKILFN